MYKLGVGTMWAAFWIAVLGLYMSEPVGGSFENRHIISFALRGLEIRLLPSPQAPSGFWIDIVAGRWLLGCLVIFLIGLALFLGGRRRRIRRHGV